MSDAGRKSFTDKASEAAKPDSEKSYLEQATEKVTNALDTGAGKAQSGKEKSTSQSIGDSITGSK